MNYQVPGKTIRSMMRRHRVTIAVLAERMQLTKARVREVRRLGLQAETCRGDARVVAMFAKDWAEGITGRAFLPE